MKSKNAATRSSYVVNSRAVDFGQLPFFIDWTQGVEYINLDYTG